MAEEERQSAMTILSVVLMADTAFAKAKKPLVVYFSPQERPVARECGHDHFCEHCCG